MKKLLLVLLFITSITSYSQIPTGYYDSATGTGYTLKTQLYTIIKDHTDNGYSGLWTTYQTSDRDIYYENDNTILDMYSEDPSAADPYNFTFSTDQCGTYSIEGDCYNREHIIPQSVFNQGSPMRNDAHFVTPTDGKVNGYRSNFPHGLVGTQFSSSPSENGSKWGSSSLSGYSGTVFEPIDEFKGDIARMYFYFATRYENVLTTWGVSYDMFNGTTDQVFAEPFLTLLMTWHTNDPVSVREIGRNDAIYARQNNRNPFIDHPEYVAQIWSATADTQDPTTPTNLTASNITNTTVDLTWTASTDNVGVTSYDIYVDGSLFDTSVSNSTTLTGLTINTSYAITVYAKDAFGNTSTVSNTENITTLNTNTPSSCGSETFTSSNATSSYTNNSFTGDNGVSWNYVESRNQESFSITGTGLLLRNTSSKLTSSSIPNGIGEFTCDLLKGFTGAGSRQVTLFINGIFIENSIAWDNTTVQKFTVSGINVPGDVIVEIRNATGKQVVIDNISWTCYTAPDSEAPSTISDVVASNITSTSADLSWTAATDNIGVTSYEIFKDFVFLASSAINSYAISRLTESTSYDFTVYAKDAAGNTSLVSNTETFTTLTDSSVASELFISEYTEDGNNKAIEIANFTGSSVDLSNYSIKKQVNGNGTWDNQLNFTSSALANGTVYVIANGNASSAIKDVSNQTTLSAPIDFNGDDPIGLFFGTTLIDVVGYTGDVTFGENVTLRRKSTISSPNTTYTVSEWDVLTGIPLDDLGSHALSSLSVQEFVKNLFRVYPNPTKSNSITITVTNNETINGVQFYNLIGQLIVDYKNIGAIQNKIEIQNIPSGFYIVKVFNDTTYSTKRLIVE